MTLQIFTILVYTEILKVASEYITKYTRKYYIFRHLASKSWPIVSSDGLLLLRPSPLGTRYIYTYILGIFMERERKKNIKNKWLVKKKILSVVWKIICARYEIKRALLWDLSITKILLYTDPDVLAITTSVLNYISSTNAVIFYTDKSLNIF